MLTITLQCARYAAFLVYCMYGRISRQYLMLQTQQEIQRVVSEQIAHHELSRTNLQVSKMLLARESLSCEDRKLLNHGSNDSLVHRYQQIPAPST